MFHKELAVLSKLDHPNVVRTFGFCPDPLAIVAEAIEGGSLHDFLHARESAGVSPLTGEEAVQVALGIARGLSYIHGYGIIHRDMKPQNVMLRKAQGKRVGDAVIVDFGLSKIIDDATSSMAATDTYLGTIPYSPPEAFAAFRLVGPPGDVWSFGCILAEMITGRPPWSELPRQDILAIGSAVQLQQLKVPTGTQRTLFHLYPLTHFTYPSIYKTRSFLLSLSPAEHPARPEEAGRVVEAAAGGGRHVPGARYAACGEAECFILDLNLSSRPCSLPHAIPLDLPYTLPFCALQNASPHPLLFRPQGARDRGGGGAHADGVRRGAAGEAGPRRQVTLQLRFGPVDVRRPRRPLGQAPRRLR